MVLEWSNKMPSINISKETYQKLQEVMAKELRHKLQATDQKAAMLEIVKNKFGISFNYMVLKLLKDYKIK